MPLQSGLLCAGPPLDKKYTELRARKSGESKGSQRGNSYWAHSLLIQDTGAVEVLKMLL